MILRLILTRHAKSNWDDPLLDDFDRPLNGRGRASATAIGGWLGANGYVPDQALVSAAARTRETWARIGAELPDTPEPKFSHKLYLASPESLFGAAKKASGKVVMLIAHNPGSAYLAEGLAAHPPQDSRFFRYPTAATTIFDFDCDSWGDISWQSGKVVDFVVPRDLL